MRRRRLVPVLLAVIVAVVAACSGVVGDSNSTVDRGANATATREVETMATREIGATSTQGIAAMPTQRVEATVTRAIETTPTQRVEPTATPSAVPTPTQTPEPTATPTPSAMPTPPAGPLAGEQLVSALRRGGYILYFRHAATDPVPDDAVPVVLDDCSTQRSLSAAGRAQSSAIGRAIERLQIPIGDMLSSPFCRCLETAQLAFGRATPEATIENLETVTSEAERQARIDGLRRLLAIRPEGPTNSVLVAHGNILSAVANVTVVEGGAAIFRPEGENGFTLVATVTPQQWTELAAAFE